MLDAIISRDVHVRYVHIALHRSAIDNYCFNFASSHKLSIILYQALDKTGSEHRYRIRSSHESDIIFARISATVAKRRWSPHDKSKETAANFIFLKEKVHCQQRRGHISRSAGPYLSFVYVISSETHRCGYPGEGKDRKWGKERKFALAKKRGPASSQAGGDSASYLLGWIRGEREKSKLSSNLSRCPQRGIRGARNMYRESFEIPTEIFSARPKL